MKWKLTDYLYFFTSGCASSDAPVPQINNAETKHWNTSKTKKELRKQLKWMMYNGRYTIPEIIIMIVSGFI